MKFAEIKKRKLDISSRSALISERNIIDQVFEDLNQSIFNSPRKLKKFSLKQNILMDATDNGKVNVVMKLIEEEDFESVRNYDENIVECAMKKIYIDPSSNFDESLKRVDFLELADSRKIQKVKMVRLYRSDIT